jgi:hypothetical protein
MAEKVPDKYPMSNYLAEKFSRYYEVYVCPYGLSLYNRRTGMYVEHWPIYPDGRSANSKEEKE